MSLQPEKKIFLITNDLIFRSKIENTARQLKISIVVLPPNFQLSQIQLNGRGLILADLDRADINFEMFIHIKNTYGDNIKIIGYVPHVRTEQIKKAKTSGFDQVMARSKFVQELANILSIF